MQNSRARATRPAGLRRLGWSIRERISDLVRTLRPNIRALGRYIPLLLFLFIAAGMVSVLTAPLPGVARRDVPPSPEDTKAYTHDSPLSDVSGTRVGAVMRHSLDERYELALSPSPSLPATIDPRSMEWPVPGNVSATFGWGREPVYKEWRFQPGITIETPFGTPVLAALPGIVRQVGNDAEIGLNVIVDHGGGWSTQYGYLSAVQVQVGEQVRSKQVVGRSGSNVGQDSPCLRFIVRHEAEPVDPLGYLPAR